MEGYITLPNGDKFGVARCMAAMHLLEQQQEELIRYRVVELELLLALSTAKDMLIATECLQLPDLAIIDTALDKATAHLWPSTRSAANDAAE